MRDDLRIPDLTFPKMSYGKMETPWDLKMLLYQGGATARRRKVLEMIDAGKLGAPLLERLELVERLHDVVSSSLEGGGSPETLDSSIEAMRQIFTWADQAEHVLTLATIESIYQYWTDYLLHRVKVLRDLKEYTAYCYGAKVGRLIDLALDRQAAIIELTGLKFPSQRKTAVGVQAEKQNLEHTFKFGHCLQDISDALTVETVLSGSLPVRISLRSGAEIVAWSGYTAIKTRENLQDRKLDTGQRRYRARISDRKFTAFQNEGTLRTRYPLANLRITAELFMFIGQTGMNVAQAHQLKMRHFSYSSHLDGYQVKDYKFRRGGEVLFEIYREYKPHFERYLAWRRELFPDSDLLFPLLRVRGRAESTRPTFPDFRLTCIELGIPYITPSALRNTRVNWLLRRSGDPDLTAEMAQHTNETLLGVYERPSLQRAIGETMRFWSKSDPALARTVPVAPGECDGEPVPVKDMPKDAPLPDCVQASGCLWCEHHRDIDSKDYCWSLACFRHLKVIEVGKWRAPNGSRETHPSEYAVVRISDKLRWFHESNTKRRGWVDEAFALVEEGQYHPDWKRLIVDVEGAA